MVAVSCGFVVTWMGRIVLIGLGCVVTLRWVWLIDLRMDFGFCGSEFAGILGSGGL